MGAPAPIKRASTVIVLRESARGPEVFMVRRTFTIAFMAGAHVFPGGRVDELEDAADESWCDLPSGDAAMRWPDMSFGVSAARELFEEAGVLIARLPGGAIVPIEAGEARARFEGHRVAVHDKARRFREVLQAEALRLALNDFVPFAHWVTPPLETRRFDTWFFLARVPPAQRPVHDGVESVESAWFRPADALKACLDGEIHLPPPTWATLRELESWPSTDAAFEWAAARQVVERQPLLVEGHGTREIFLPGDPRHPSSEKPSFETHFVWTGDRWLPDQKR